DRQFVRAQLAFARPTQVLRATRKSRGPPRAFPALPSFASRDVERFRGPGAFVRARIEAARLPRALPPLLSISASARRLRGRQRRGRGTAVPRLERLQGLSLRPALRVVPSRGALARGCRDRCWRRRRSAT